MGCDTKLYLSKRWGIDDIRDVIQSHLGCEVKIESNHSFAPVYFTFYFTHNNHARMMHVHSDSNCPIGPCTMLSLGMNDHAIEIMRTIAEVIGGILEENDCGSQGCEMIEGKFWEENHLAYHLKYSIIHNRCDGESVEQLKSSIAQWDKEIKEGRVKP